MSRFVNINNVIQHLVNGTFEQQVCFVCLFSIDGACEDLFTIIGGADQKYSVAYLLERVGNVNLSHCENNKICEKCFKLAVLSFKFNTMIQRSQEILHFYLDKLQNCLQDIKYSRGGPLGIKLTKFNASTQYFDYMLEDPNFTDILQEQPQDVEDRNNYCVNEKGEDEIVLVMNDNAVPSFFKSQNGQLKSLNRTEINGFSGTDCVRKKRAKRKPMVYKSCTQCSVKYRFLGKLKYHMKVKHGLNAVICKICKIIVDNEEEYESHLQTHGEVYSCDKCHMVFKRRDAMLNHLKWHTHVEELANADGTYICEVCGIVVESDEHLQEHYNKKHVNKFTCFYCGRMYMAEANFEAHIKKHEVMDEKLSLLKQKKDGRRKKFVCTKCDNSFVDERTLLWHSRLHTNERPYPYLWSSFHIVEPAQSTRVVRTHCADATLSLVSCSFSPQLYVG
ncbi:gastrula zinc finger protein xFG20-1-like [Leptidea sinapis]|uniref:gastrula zinc finger protein xFG20-1-like n=1 Tax=Leptidea sinapis TaxID=189913 RepID=UPI0021C37EB6|nr:gastrula zinc finger protein xFG20-1-like [Leptidea sinapis]